MEKYFRENRKKVRGSKKHKSLGQQLISYFSVLMIGCLLVLGGTTFLVIKYHVTQDFKDSTLSVMTQTENYVEALLTTVDSLYVDFYADKEIMTLVSNPSMSDEEKETGRKTMTDKLMQEAIGNSFNIVSGMTFYSEKGLTASFPNVPRSLEESNEAMAKAKQQEWYQKVIESKGKPFWLSSHEEKIVEGSPDTYVSSISTIRGKEKDEVLGILKIDVKSNVLARILEDTKVGKEGEILIVDEAGKIVASKEKERIGTKIGSALFQKMKDQEQCEFNFKQSGKAVYGVAARSKYNQWTYVAMVPRHELFGTAMHIGRYMLLITLGCLAVCAVLSKRVATQITKPVNETIQLTEQLAEGDLTAKSKVSQIKEMNLLAEHFNKMTQHLSATLHAALRVSDQSSETSDQLSLMADQLKDSSGEVSLAIQEIAQGSMEQVEETTKCKAISNDLGEKIHLVVDQMKDAAENSDDCIHTVETGKDIVKALNKSSVENASTIEEVVETIGYLEKNTQSLFVILERINGITTQTNLLALNASIEAARSGEVGKGFAVVAEEIRKLSMQSQEAADEINEILQVINSTVGETIDISKKAESGFLEEERMVDQTVESFDAIKEKMTDVAASINEMKDYIQAIEEGKNHLSQNIEHITSISESNASATEETMAYAETQESSAEQMKVVANQLLQQGQKLNEMLKQFTLEECASDEA